MATYNLPPLPEPFMELHREISPSVYAAWADQMRAYGAACAAAERERCAKVCEELDRKRSINDYYSYGMAACAAAIRAMKDEQ